MERRRGTDRRQTHMFVSEERRTGPFDRRGAEGRHRERMREVRQIERINAYKAKERAERTKPPLLTKKRVAVLALALLVVIVAVILAG